MPDQGLNNAAYEGDSVMGSIEPHHPTSTNNSPKRSPGLEHQPQVKKGVPRKRLHNPKADLGHGLGVDGPGSNEVCISPFRGRWGLNNSRHAYDSFDPDAILKPPPKLPAPPTSNWVEPSVASSKASKNTKGTEDEVKAESNLGSSVQPASENQSNASTTGK